MPSVPKPSRLSSRPSGGNPIFQLVDHTAYIQHIFNSASTVANAASATISDAVFPPGRFGFSNTVSIPVTTAVSSVVRGIGAGQDATIFYPLSEFATGTILLKLNNPASTNVWGIANPVICNAVAAGATSIIASAGATPATGWYVLADDNLNVGDTAKWKCLLVQITAIAGSALTTNVVIPRAHTSGTVALYPVEGSVSYGTELHNLQIDGFKSASSAYISYPMQAYFLAHLLLKNTRVRRFGVSGIQVFVSKHLRAYDTMWDEMDPQFTLTAGRGRGFDQYRCYDIIVSGITFHGLRHGLQGSSISDFLWTDIVSTSGYSANIDLHGMQSIDGEIRNFSLRHSPSGTNDETALKIGNDSFKDWERDIWVHNGWIEPREWGPMLLTQGAQNCLIENVSGMGKFGTSSYVHPSIGTVISSAVTFNNCYAIAACADVVNDGFMGFSPGGYCHGYVFNNCAFLNKNANGVQCMYTSDLSGNTDITFRQCWFDKSAGTDGPGFLCFGTSATTGTLSLVFSGCVANLASGATSLPFRYSTSNGYDQKVNLSIISCYQLGNGSTFSYSGSAVSSEITEVSVISNVASAAAQTIPTSIPDMISKMGTVIPGVIG